MRYLISLSLLLVGCTAVPTTPITKANYTGGQYDEVGQPASTVYPYQTSFGSTGGDGAAAK